MSVVNLNKNASENECQYLWRIGGMVDDGYITNWESVVSIINHQLYGDDTSCYKGESAFRKRYQAARQFYKNVFVKEGINDESEKIAMRINELQIERQKINAEKIELSRYNRQRARLELFYENLAKDIGRFPEPPCLLKYAANADADTEKKYILTIADVHYGSNFVTDNNIYNIAECERRFETLLNESVTFVKKNSVKELTVVNLGDEIQGLLRMSDVQLNETSVVKAVVGVSRLIANFLNELSMSCRVKYYSVPRSNHTQIRPLGSKANELAGEDISFVINNYIKDILSANGNIEVFVGKEGYYIDIPVFDYKIVATHGHTVKNTNTLLQELTTYRREFIDYVLVGHRHNHDVTSGNCATMYDTEVIVTPSFIGGDPYAESLLKCSKPACMILGFDKSKGLNETHKIILD